jgi:hypothetical protein
MSDLKRSRSAVLPLGQKSPDGTGQHEIGVDKSASTAPVVQQPPKSLHISAEKMIDPGIGLHSAEWADAKTHFRWSGAWPFVKFIERLDRSTPCQISVVVMAFAHGVSAHDVKCFVDDAPVSLSIGEEYGLTVLRATASRSDLSCIEIRLESPLVDEGGGLNRKIGFGIVALNVAR